MAAAEYPVQTPTGSTFLPRSARMAGMGPKASEAPASRTRVVKPLAPTRLFHLRGPLRKHLQPQGLLLVGFLLTCHCLHKAGPELLLNQLRGKNNSPGFMLRPHLHQRPLSTLTMQPPSSPACSRARGTAAVTRFCRFFFFPSLSSLWISLSWTQLAFLLAEPTSSHFAAMPRLQQKPKLPRRPQKINPPLVLTALRFPRRCQRLPGAGLRSHPLPTAQTSGVSEDTHCFSAPE